MMFQAAVVLLTLLTLTTALYTNDPEEQKRLFHEFKSKHGKSYASIEEENVKFGVFLKKLELIDARNEEERKKGGSAVHGITKFSDLTEEEFKQKYLKVIRPKAFKERKVARKASSQSNVSPQSLVDWTGAYILQCVMH